MTDYKGPTASQSIWLKIGAIGLMLFVGQCMWSHLTETSNHPVYAVPKGWHMEEVNPRSRDRFVIECQGSNCKPVSK